jgi:hypothetical protein
MAPRCNTLTINHGRTPWGHCQYLSRFLVRSSSAADRAAVQRADHNADQRDGKGYAELLRTATPHPSCYWPTARMILQAACTISSEGIRAKRDSSLGKTAR